MQQAAVNGTASVTVVRSTIAHNTIGLNGIEANTTIRLSQSTLMGNAVGWEANFGSIVRSHGDNYVDGNNNGDPAPPTIVDK